MRTPLHDVLVTEGDAPATSDAGQQLAVLFEAAQRRENQYAAERLSELHQLAERALTLGVEVARAEPKPPAPPAPWPMRVASVAAGGLLAFAAPVLAETSVLLAGLAGLSALGAVVLPFVSGRGRERVAPALPSPERSDARLRAVASAADRALQAMVEPRALPAPTTRSAKPDDDVLGLLQDAIALGHETDEPAAKELAENAARLARHMGFEPAFEGEDGLFETMVDPSVPAPITLRPALVDRSAPDRTVHGVRVTGRA